MSITMYRPRTQPLWLLTLRQLPNLLLGGRLAAIPLLSRVRRSLLERLRGRSVAIREVDAGSSGAPESSFKALSSPAYSLSQLGYGITAAFRHADLIAYSGPPTHNMAPALRGSLAQQPVGSRRVVTLGDRALNGGIYRSSYAVALEFLPDLNPEQIGLEDLGNVVYVGHVAGSRPAAFYRSGVAPTPLQIIQELILPCH